MPVTRLVYEITSTASSANPAYIDLARDLSIINRRLVRQKQLFTVHGGLMKDSGGADIQLSTVPMTWTSKLAINRTFRKWREAQKRLHDKTDGYKAPKYNDFKVYMDTQHIDSRALSPIYNSLGGATVTHTRGEWNYSTFSQPKLRPSGSNTIAFDEDADQWTVHVIGRHASDGIAHTTNDEIDNPVNYSRVGAIRSWKDSRATPHADTPELPTGQARDLMRIDPLSNLYDIDDDDNEYLDIAIDENETAPYSFESVQGYNDNEHQLVSFADNSSGEPDIVTVPGFQALCGLVRIDVISENNLLLILDVETEGEAF